VAGNFIYERDSTERFYGFGNDSDQDDESNYTGNLIRALATPGVWILPYVNVAYQMRMERYSIGRGQVDTIPFIQSEFPLLTRKGRFRSTFYWAHRASIAYDSRDSFDIRPAARSRSCTSKEPARFSAARRGSSSSASTGATTFRSGRAATRSSPSGPSPTTSRRATTRPSGSSTRSAAGGRSARTAATASSTPIARSSAASCARACWQRRMFGVNAEIEVAPFVEAGKVFPNLADDPINHPHWAYGMGFRGIARPQIVGFVDVGAGSEGLAVFTGVNYPFLARGACGARPRAALAGCAPPMPPDAVARARRSRARLRVFVREAVGRVTAVPRPAEPARQTWYARSD
jgi:hypothetical protein